MAFIVHCTDKPGHQEVRLANRAAHLEHLKSVLDKVLMAGPTLTEDGQGMTSSLLGVACVGLMALRRFCR